MLPMPYIPKTEEERKEMNRLTQEFGGGTVICWGPSMLSHTAFTPPTPPTGGTQDDEDDEDDPDPVSVIPATEESEREYSDDFVTCGNYHYILRPEHITALEQGQALVLEIGTEYLAFVRLGPEVLHE